MARKTYSSAYPQRARVQTALSLGLMVWAIWATLPPIEVKIGAPVNAQNIERGSGR